MNICSAVVHTRPERYLEVQQRLVEFPGVEIHGGSDAGKLIVTIEGEGDEPLADTLTKFNYVEGVLNTVMIYHYCGDGSLDEEARQ